NKTGIRWNECLELFEDNLTDDDKEEISGEIRDIEISTNSTSNDNTTDTNLYKETEGMTSRPDLSSIRQYRGLKVCEPLPWHMFRKYQLDHGQCTKEEYEQALAHSA